MKKYYYEFILKYKELNRSTGWEEWKIKFRNPKVPEENFEFAKKKFEEARDSAEEDCILLINKLDENLEFVEVVL